LLGLGHLDRYLFGEYLSRSNHPMELYGSSIGSWRHAALASINPGEAIATLQDRYMNQQWAEDDARSPSEVVDGLCEWVLDSLLTPDDINHITTNPRFRTHIVTALGLGLNSHQQKSMLALGMGKAAILNMINRQLLARSFQRIVFSTGVSESFVFKDFDTEHVEVNPENLRSALLASGSIPFLMSGQRDIVGAPDGHYWDGGIIDYHFDFANCAGDGLVLYPHFSDQIVPGWFDKSLKRRTKTDQLDNVVIVAPSRDYIASLPYGKIPDRRDFQKISQPLRLAYWGECISASQVLADAFIEVIESPDPLRFVAAN
ncbi:MAG: patatin-like phospholipase family protein, partial [Pseudomonadales bacterium]|nr:patatin-like phospholipase family protein [Pseudomonadales bacterium]